MSMNGRPGAHGSVLDQAANRDGGVDVAGCGHGLCEGEAGIDQRRPAKTSDAGDRRPDRLSDLAVRLRPELPADDTDLVEDVDILDAAAERLSTEIRLSAIIEEVLKPQPLRLMHGKRIQFCRGDEPDLR